jgi:hypothetical protein
MTTSAMPATDRSDFRHILMSGTKVGLVTGVSVVVFLALSRLLPAGIARTALEALLVLLAGVLVSLLPGQWVGSRGTEGVAGAAAVGLWGTVVFMAFDIVLLRPFKAYPWTWDAIGGGSTWWYLPIWWMLGTFVAWMGGMLTAGRNARGPASLGQIATPVVLGAVVLAAVAKVTLIPVAWPVLIGGAYVVTLTALALWSIIRKPSA